MAKSNVVSNSVPKIKSSKASSSPRFAHTSDTKKGVGNYYGTGVKNPVGKMREGMGMATLSKKKLGTPPKKLA